MCAMTYYADLYRRHAGHNTPYHLWRVRIARELINQHRAECPDCRNALTSNFNLREPARVTYRMGAKGAAQ